MNTKEFVAKQLEIPEHTRVIPDRIYMCSNRLGIIHALRVGIEPFNAGDVFLASILYEPAPYFRPGRIGNYRYYPNGVFSILPSA